MKHVKPLSKASAPSTSEIVTMIVGLLTALAPIITWLIGKANEQQG